MDGEAPVRLAVRVHDVARAAELYQSFGFTPVGAVPAPDGTAVMTILRRGPLQLLVDALSGIPFPDTARERQTKTGPRGLGVVIGLQVQDVDDAARRCQADGRTITTSPADAPWGERSVELEDPYGYAWKFFHLTADPPADGLSATHARWYGPPTPDHCHDPPG